jgi:hypothetical protein
MGEGDIRPCSREAQCRSSKLSATGFLLKSLPFAIEYDIMWRLNIRLHRKPSSAPFLSGDTFQRAADLVLEENQELARKKRESQDIVFCASSRAANVLKARRLREGCVLIVHHGDVNIESDFQRLLDGSRCAHVFAQNCLVQDPRISPLPIGLEDQWRHNHGIVRDFIHLRRKIVQKIPRIVNGFNLGTNPDERWPCYRSLWRHPLAVGVSAGTNSRLYRKYINRYMFVASPPGNGADCHRTWEAMYLRVVPILKRSVMAESFQQLGLPLHIVDDWRELSSLTEESLVDIYSRLAPGFDSNALWFPYWKKQFIKYCPSAA